MPDKKEISEQKTASCLDTGRKLIQIISGIINDTKADIPATSGEDNKLYITILHLESELGTLAATDPIALGLLERVGPVNLVQSI